MEPKQNIYTYFERIFSNPLSLTDKEKIDSLSKKETFRKKQLIFSQGDINTRHYYIEKGLLRMFITDADGKEFNILFASENQWIGDLGTPSPTSFYLDAIEESTVYSFDDEAFREITHDMKYMAGQFKKSYIFLQKRFVSILSKTAEENYEELCKNYPKLIQRLPQYHISSYLGVTPVFLSKIMAKRARRKE
jgi:CRP-like cAMP-binding protein